VITLSIACRFGRDMDYHEIREILRSSAAGHWLRIAHGPLFLDAWAGIARGDGDDAFHSEFISHYSRAVYGPMVELAIAWGCPQDRDLSFEWAHWPDPSVDREYVDILWNGAIVDRYLGLSVDGGRAFLPQPAADVLNEEYVAERITETQDNLFRIIAGLEQRNEHDTYLKQAGFVVVPG
jgi:hypothetical protein